MTKHSILALAFASIIGCQPQGTTPKPSVETPVQSATTSQAETPEATKTDASTAPASANVSEVALRVSTFDELQATIAKHQGKIVVCDFWSTSCEPCVREFPQLIKLSQKYPAEQVVCISASLDFDGLGPLDSYKGPVLEFLKEKQAKIDNVLFGQEDTVIYEKAKIASIPVVMVYGPDGSRLKTFDESSGKEFTYEADINPFVANLVQTHFAK